MDRLIRNVIQKKLWRFSEGSAGPVTNKLAQGTFYDIFSVNTHTGSSLPLAGTELGRHSLHKIKRSFFPLRL